MTLITDGEAPDQAYRNVRAADNDYTRWAKANCEELWLEYEPHADPEFAVELRSNFDARYWEMYLTVALMRQGLDVHCPKPGPDVGIVVNGQPIWFEATSPTRGADGSPDQVPEPPLDGVAYDVPNERMVLRYLNSISVKFERQYPNWLKNGVVQPKDALIVCVNPRRLWFDHADTDPPRILQAAFAIGSQYIVLDRDTLRHVGSGYHLRDKIQKASGSTVPTGLFQREEYCALSGLLCSRVDACNQPHVMGADFQLVPNPNANSPLPQALRLKGTYFRIDRTEDGYKATPEQVV